MSLRSTTLVVAALLQVTVARAQSANRVVVASGDAELVHAMRAALAPVGLAVTEVAERAELDSPEAVPAARRLVAAEQAVVAVWVTDGAGSSSVLTVFDLSLDRVITRELPHAAPFTPAQAASAALMVRTMLRAHHLNPTVIMEPPSGASVVSVVDDGGDPWKLRVDAGAGTTLGGWGSARFPAIVGGVAGYWTHLGAALTLAWSPGERRDDATFVGRLEDNSAGLTLRFPIQISRWTLEPGAGLALHWVRVAGTNSGQGQAVEIDRFDPAGRLTGVAVFSATRWIDPALWCEADVLMRRQRLLSGDEVVASLSRVQVICGLVVRLKIR